MRKIPAFKLQLVPLDEEAETLPRFQSAVEGIGERSKLGGEPDFIQRDDIPSCPSCSKAMTFYAQLDSLNDDIILADCGMIYVFVCFECFETTSVLQSY